MAASMNNNTRAYTMDQWEAKLKSLEKRLNWIDRITAKSLKRKWGQNVPINKWTNLISKFNMLSTWSPFGRHCLRCLTVWLLLTNSFLLFFTWIQKLKNQHQLVFLHPLKRCECVRERNKRMKSVLRFHWIKDVVKQYRSLLGKGSPDDAVNLFVDV